jgi:hypothetical protein
LNKRPLPEIPFHDVIVFSGVLEYVNDVPAVVDHLTPSCASIVSSYVAAIPHARLGRLHRRRAGWVNDYSAEEFTALFEQRGFELTMALQFNGAQQIYSFRNTRARES